MDEAQYDWYIHDIAIIFFHYAWRFQTSEKTRDQVITEFAPHFMKGYLAVNQLAEEEIRAISLFIKSRHLRLFCTLAYELGIKEDEYSRKLLNTWQPMLEKNQNWIDPQIIIDLIEE